MKSTDSKMDYTCKICKHSATGKALLLQHCRSVKHLQMEQLHLLQLRAEGGGQSPEIGDIFTVAAVSENADPAAEQENKGKDEISSHCRGFTRCTRVSIAQEVQLQSAKSRLGQRSGPTWFTGN